MFSVRHNVFDLTNHSIKIGRSQRIQQLNSTSKCFRYFGFYLNLKIGKRIEYRPRNSKFIRMNGYHCHKIKIELPLSF